jgi:hypothetical protein
MAQFNLKLSHTGSPARGLQDEQARDEEKPRRQSSSAFMHVCHWHDLLLCLEPIERKGDLSARPAKCLLKDSSPGPRSPCPPSASGHRRRELRHGQTRSGAFPHPLQSWMPHACDRTHRLSWLLPEPLGA